MSNRGSIVFIPRSCNEQIANAVQRLHYRPVMGGQRAGNARRVDKVVFRGVPDLNEIIKIQLACPRQQWRVVDTLLTKKSIMLFF